VLLALLRARLTRSPFGTSAAPPHRPDSSNRRLASPQKGCGARLRRGGGVKTKTDNGPASEALAR